MKPTPRHSNPFAPPTSDLGLRRISNWPSGPVVSPSRTLAHAALAAVITLASVFLTFLIPVLWLRTAWSGLPYGIGDFTALAIGLATFVVTIRLGYRVTQRLLDGWETEGQH